MHAVPLTRSPRPGSRQLHAAADAIAKRGRNDHARTVTPARHHALSQHPGPLLLRTAATRGTSVRAACAPLDIRNGPEPLGLDLATADDAFAVRAPLDPFQ